MTLLDHVRVDLCGVTTSTGVATADGAEWLVSDEIEGWDAPTQRSSLGEPTALNGVRLVGPLHGGRELIVRGEVFADSREEAWAAYYRATGAMPGLQGEGDLVVYEDVVKWLRVRQAGPPLVTSPVGGFFTFELHLLAEYPYKRALDPIEVEIDAGTTGTVTNPGNAAAEIIVTSQAVGSMSLEAYGARLATSVSLPAGSVMDSLTRTIVNDIGENRYPFIQRNSQWLAAPPGDTPFANTGTAPVIVTIYPTYA